MTRRFTAEDLLNAEIIAQIDRKFIACLIDDHLDDGNDDANGKSIVLIDQHAADERIRVERYLKELCLGFLLWDDGVGGHRTRELSPAIAILLTRREAHRLSHADDVQMVLKRWGFLFADFPRMNDAEMGDCGDGGDGYVQIYVLGVPAIVGAKVQSISSLQPAELTGNATHSSASGRGRTPRTAQELPWTTGE
jgi:DNA mismatch repair protein MLH3